MPVRAWKIGGYVAIELKYESLTCRISNTFTILDTAWVGAINPWSWVEHLHEERSSLTLLAEQGPKDNPRVPDNFARYGLLGERWADPIVNGMFTTSSYYSIQHFTDWATEIWNESIDAGFSNPLDQFIYERAHGWLGDDFINSHTTLETMGALWLAGHVKSTEWVTNGLLDVRASAMELLARKLHIWGLYAEGEWDLALRQDTAFNLALMGESSVFGEMIGGPMIMLTRYGLNGLFDAGIPSPESVQKDMLQMGRSIHLGAANSGQQSALAVDVAYRTAEIAVQIAADVAISIVTMGVATPAVAAKWAATAATWAAKAANAATRVVRLAVTAAKYVGKQMMELASAAVKLGQRGWQMLRAGAKFTVENSGKLLSQAKNFAADVPGLLRTAATKAVQSTKTGLQALGRKTFDTVEQGVSTVVHGWFGESKLHNPLTRFASRLGFRACFVAGTPIRTSDGSKPIEEFKSYEEHGDDCDYVLARSEFDPNGPVRARRVLRKFVRVAPVLNLHVGGRVIGTTAEHPFFVEGKGWTPAFDLKIGDRLLMEDGQCLRVEGVADNGRVETVYNMEVEDDHTYFVGEQNWGWAVWSHNADYADVPAITARMQRYIQRRLDMFARGFGDCERHAVQIAKMLERNGVRAAVRSPTGPGRHTMVLLQEQGMILDVTARQFTNQAAHSLIRARFYSQLTQTGLWTRQEYNAFWRLLFGPLAGF